MIPAATTRQGGPATPFGAHSGEFRQLYNKKTWPRKSRARSGSLITLARMATQPDNPTGGPSARFDPAGYHDTALRTHMIELVRILTRNKEYDRLNEMLGEHRDFIDQVLETVNGT